MAQAKGDKPIVVITGVSTGIGLGFVEKFASQNWLVFGCARSKDKIAELNAKYPNKDDNKKCEYFAVVDVTDAKAMSEWAAQLAKDYGAPTILLVNAGLGQQPDLLEDTAVEKFDKIINININGAFYTCRAFLPFMKNDKSKGNNNNNNNNKMIVGMSSGAGRNGFEGIAPYCASKFGLEGLFAALSKELENTNLFCITYDPGMVATNMFSLTNHINPNELQNIGMPTVEDITKEAYPEFMQLLKNGKENNGKQLTSPVVTSKEEKYVKKVNAAIKAWQENGGSLKKKDNNDSKQDN